MLDFVDDDDDIHSPEEINLNIFIWSSLEGM